MTINTATTVGSKRDDDEYDDNTVALPNVDKDETENTQHQKQQQQQQQQHQNQQQIIVPGSSKRLQCIIQQYYKQIQQIDLLEKRINERTVQCRKRISSLVEQVPNVRKSQLRLFISHSYQNSTATDTATTTSTTIDNTNNNTNTTKRMLPKPGIWTLNIDGQLLIDHLDYESAVQYDTKTNYIGGSSDNTNGSSDYTDRSRGGGSNDTTTKEEEKGDFISKILFTKYFDTMKVTYQTTFYNPEKLLLLHNNQQAQQSQQQQFLDDTYNISKIKNKKVTKRTASQESDDTISIATTGSTTGNSNTGANSGTSSALIVDPKSLYLSSKQTLVWTKDMICSTVSPTSTSNTSTAGTGTGPGNVAAATTTTPIPVSSIPGTTSSATVTTTATTTTTTTSAVAAAGTGTVPVPVPVPVYTNIVTTYNNNINDLSINDANVICFEYVEPQPPPLSAAGSGGLTVYSVIATIELYCRKNYYYTPPNSTNTTTTDNTGTTVIDKNSIGSIGTIDEYRIINKRLAQLLFPSYDPDRTDVLGGTKKRKLPTKQQSFAMSDSSTGSSINTTDNTATGTVSPPAVTKVYDPTVNVTIGVSPIISSNDDIPPEQNEIYLPVTLSIKEIIKAFYIYIRDNKLFDISNITSSSLITDYNERHNNNNEATIINCKDDTILYELFNVDSFSFCNLQQLLISNKLIEKINTLTCQPISITYVMKKDTAWDLCKPFYPNNTAGNDVSSTSTKITSTTSSNNNNIEPTVLQLDIDCTVPSLFPYRCRELLRRVKRRELEYTSVRNKARYLLQPRTNSTSGAGNTTDKVTTGTGTGTTTTSTSATYAASATTTTTTTSSNATNVSAGNYNNTVNKEEESELIRKAIEQVIQQESVTEDLIPVYLALSKAAPINSEARNTPHYDARMAYTLGRIQEHYNSAQYNNAILESIIKK